jgi:Na+/melibiose symporter-like transporter
MFYSRAASRLSGIEDAHVNTTRVWLRKINGMLMFLLAISFFSGFFAVDLDHPTRMTAIVWLAVCGLVLALLALGLVDLRLTWRLRNAQRPEFPIDKHS